MIPLCFVLIGCQGQEYQWGEASEALSHDWCEARERCEAAGGLDVCIRHNMHHLCELNEICDVAVPEAEAMVGGCLGQLQAIDGPEHEDCFLVHHGVVPEACVALLDLKPGGQ